ADDECCCRPAGRGSCRGAFAAGDVSAGASLCHHKKELPMDLQLTNKKALVTGSTAGIGLAIASLLAEEGVSVVVNGRSRQRVEEAVERIRTQAKNARVTGMSADLGTKEGVTLLIRDLPTV